MPSLRKRTLREVEPDLNEDVPRKAHRKSEPSETPAMLQRLRNMWQFANLYQWIYLFGKVVKIDEGLDIDDLETECLKSDSTVLAEIGLALLKWLSSHRNLTPELFDEYTRRQFRDKAKNKKNPFGEDETPARFNDFDVFTKISVLQQMTQFVMISPDRIRREMDEQKVTDQTEWRIEPYGWDSDDRTYFVLDDNRLYRITEAPSPTPVWRPKKNSKKAKAAARAAKRRRVSMAAEQDADDEGSPSVDAEGPDVPEDDGLGGAKWECVASTLDDVRQFLSSIQKSRDENEKVLRQQLEEHLLPILEKQDESRKRKVAQREKELLNLAKMANAKRSSRLANKAEQHKAEEQAREEERQRLVEEAVTRKEEQARLKAEKERDHRMMSRENRLKEREIRRLLHEEELAQLSEDSKNLSSGTGRLSERRVQAEIEKNRKALQELEEEEEEEDWIFDCICGAYGQVDDGTHSVACERCNVWQHSKCVGISEQEAEKDDCHFICSHCRRKQAKETPKASDQRPTIIKLKVNQPSCSSPPAAKSIISSPIQVPVLPPPTSSLVVEIPSKLAHQSHASTPINNGDTSHPAAHQPGESVIPVKHPAPPIRLPPVSPATNGQGPESNPFSSPHPTLSPPQQSPNKSRAYSTMYHSSSPSGAPASSSPPKGIFHPPGKTNGLAVNTSTNLPPMVARADSPLRLPFEAANQNLPSVSPPPVAFNASGFPSSTSKPINSAYATPQLMRDRSDVRPDTSPALPPTQNGISPIKKKSPPPSQAPVNGVHSTPAPSVLPPVAALSPSPRQQNLAPPVKSADAPRPLSRQTDGVLKEL